MNLVDGDKILLRQQGRRRRGTKGACVRVKNVLQPYKHSLSRGNKIVIVGPFQVVTTFDTVRVNTQ